MNWEDQFQLWVKAEDADTYDDRPARLIVIETRKAARNGASLDTPEGWAWVTEALKDSDRRTFVHAVFERQAAPKQLALEFLKMGVSERNPSTNRLYIEPAVRAMGARRVMRHLTEMMIDGSDDEQAGAACAAYWVRGDDADQRYREARKHFRDAMLERFVETESTYIRQRIVPSLSVDANDYSIEIAPLIANAIQIARAHPDDYIRHRIEIQLGSPGSLRPLPT